MTVALQMVRTEIAGQLRLMLSLVPSLRAPADQRSDFYLFKAAVYEALAAAEPAVAAQALAIADKAMQEAHALNLGY